MSGRITSINLAVEKIYHALCNSWEILVKNILNYEENAFALYIFYYKLAGTRVTLKTGEKTLGGRISFLPQSLPMKIIITYLIRVFDTTSESKFWALKFFFLGQFFIFLCWFEGH